ncbi:MAG TPA: hypothetical protein DCW31_10410 [Lactobacillus sp.]|nr:hypothetical protein [Lactobacillus sp.]
MRQLKFRRIILSLSVVNLIDFLLVTFNLRNLFYDYPDYSKLNFDYKHKMKMDVNAPYRLFSDNKIIKRGLTRKKKWAMLIKIKCEKRLQPT